MTRLRRFDVAEDSLQDAFVAAARVWPARGVPQRPAAWLWTTAYRRALDHLRQEQTAARRLPLLIADPPAAAFAALPAEAFADSPGEACAGPPAAALLVPPGAAELGGEDGDVPDERLRLLFACCHPALRADARAALMLRFVAGLTTAEIARLFLVSEPTMAARLTRAKAKMAVAGIPLRAPTAADLPARLDVVLKVIYLIFTEGYRATAGPDLLRPRLADEAIRLGYLVGELLPGESRTLALLALMLFQHARRDARVAPDGALILLPDQDRSRWHHDEIARGASLLGLLEATPMPGEYHLQALIAAEHAGPAPTDWPRIAHLYAELERRLPSPMIRLNRAVAIAEAGSPEAALSLLDGLTVRDSHLLPAVRAELLTRLDRPAEAAVAFDEALALVRTDPEREHLRRRRDAL
ncbi:RNA polymerase sigma factor [Paractinoplanes ferrugineus]|uniref:RNA polymerase subunit sigma-24 n=1 Tax=Paractinoplanes ferrugineus TaxID=113564 RepID=A0A919IXL8_9ACTN|nr:RNA polymerase subunit sigma-24 [Actinoplanes ferrugineus]